jgi:uncharacterized protein involved in exopolysaccharide biosynthesis
MSASPQLDIAAPTPTRPTLLSHLWTGRSLLFLGIFLGITAGLINYVRTKETYTAKAELMFPSAPASKLAALTGGSSGGDLPSVPLLDGLKSIPQPGSSAGTATDILQTLRARKDVYEALKAGHVAKSDESGELHAAVDLDKRWGTTRDQTLRRLFDNAKLKTSKSGSLEITFKDEDPALAYAIVEAMLRELDGLSEQLKLVPARDAARFLNEQAALARAEADSAQARMTDFLEARHGVPPTDEATAMGAKYAQLESDYVAAKVQSDVAVNAAAMATAGAQRLINTAIDPGPGNAGPLSTLYQRVVQLRTEKSLLLTKLTERHPDVMAKQDELDAAERALADEVKRQSALLKPTANAPVASHPAVIDAVSKAVVARAQLQGTIQARDQVRAGLTKLPRAVATYTRLSAELQARLRAEQMFREEAVKAKTVAAAHDSFFEIMDPPVLPTSHDPAGRLSAILMLTFVGLALGGIIPYLRWRKEDEAYRAARRAAG